MSEDRETRSPGSGEAVSIRFRSDCRLHFTCFSNEVKAELGRLNYVFCVYGGSNECIHSLIERAISSHDSSDFGGHGEGNDDEGYFTSAVME